MSKIPRASLSITLLGDEEYRFLMSSRRGLEAFAVFVAVLMVGRERLQQGKARQVLDSEALKFDNSPSHISAMACVSSKDIENCLSILAEVAKESGGKPWMYLDDSSHLVIRSFFKYNTATGWGGPREGAGRKPRRNQVDSSKNQLGADSVSSRIPSGSGTGSGIELTPPTPSRGGVRVSDGSDPAPNGTPPPNGQAPPAGPAGAAGPIDPAWREAVETADRLFPLRDFGPMAYALRGQVRPDVAARAFVEMKAAGKASWSYWGGIVKRLGAEPGPPPAAPAGPAAPPPPTSADDAEDAERSRAKYAAMVARAKARAEKGAGE